MENLRLLAYGGPQQATLKALKARDPKWLEWARKQSVRGQVGANTITLRAAAFLAIVPEDPQDQWLARELFRIRLDAAGPVEQIEPKATWGCAETAMAYDMVYNLLDEAERTKARKMIAAMIGQPTVERFDRDWWLDGLNPVGRPMGNWTMINVGNLGLAALAIEGEEGYNPELLRRVLHTFRESLDHGIAPDGGMYEGTSYASGYGTRQVPFLLRALERRGFDFASTTHVTRVPHWLAYELLPWKHGECFPINKSPGGVSRGGFPTWLGVNAGPLGRLVYDNLDSDAPRYNADPVIALVCGFPDAPSTRFDRLPLTHWLTTLGYSYHRTGWRPEDAHMVFTSNNIGSGHTHADNGSFALASHGAHLVVDGGGPGAYVSEWHNLVHVDGKGQRRDESALEAYVRTVETTDCADVIDVDLEPAYSRYLDARWNTMTPRRFKPYNPMRHVERRIAFIRGLTGPIVAVADDLQKDDAEHTYDWMLHAQANKLVKAEGRRFTIAQWFEGPYLHTTKPGKTVSWKKTDVPTGRYRGWLLVRSEPAPHQGWAGNRGTVNGVRTFSEGARQTYEKWPPVANHIAVPHRQVDGRPSPEADILFGRFTFGKGWAWLPLVFGDAPSPTVQVTDGTLEVTLTSIAGGQVAAAVFSRREDFEPGLAMPRADDHTVVLGADGAKSNWARGVQRPAQLTGMMLGHEVPELSWARSEKVQLNKIIARKRAVRARFLSVMSVSYRDDDVHVGPYEADDPRVVMIESDKAVDLVGGSGGGKPTTGEFVTDGMIASVSLGRGGDRTLPDAYCLVEGAELTYCGLPVARRTAGDGPVHVVNDGTRLVVRGSSGASVLCKQLSARTLVVNGVQAPMPPAEDGYVKVSVPELPDSWTVSVGPDGRTVTAVGDGPQPLKVHAPKAVEVIVNGTSRYFSRDASGHVYPVLGRGIVVIQPDGTADTSQLRKAD